MFDFTHVLTLRSRISPWLKSAAPLSPCCPTEYPMHMDTDTLPPYLGPTFDIDTDVRPYSGRMDDYGDALPTTTTGPGVTVWLVADFGDAEGIDVTLMATVQTRPDLVARVATSAYVGVMPASDCGPLMDGGGAHEVTGEWYRLTMGDDDTVTDEQLSAAWDADILGYATAQGWTVTGPAQSFMGWQGTGSVWPVTVPDGQTAVDARGILPANPVEVGWTIF